MALIKKNPRAGHIAHLFIMHETLLHISSTVEREETERRTRKGGQKERRREGGSERGELHSASLPYIRSDIGKLEKSLAKYNTQII